MSDNADEAMAGVRAEAEVAAQVFLVSDGVLPSLALILGCDSECSELIVHAQRPPLPLVLLDVARSFTENGDLGNVATPQPFWFLIAQALALQALAGAPSGRRLAQLARRFSHAPPWVYELWVDACAQRIKALSDAPRCIWIEQLKPPPPINGGAREPARSVSVTRVSAPWAVADSLQLWVEEPVALYEVGTWPPSNVLYRLDKTLWFHVVDGWPDQRLVHSALFSLGGRETCDELVEFIRVARPCFSEQGESTDACAAVVLCSGAMRKAEEVWRASAGEDPQHAVSAFLSNVATTILSRSDGRPLAAAFAARLVDEALFTDNSRRIPSPVPALAWEALRAALAANPTPVEQQRRFLSARAAAKLSRREAARCDLPALVVASATLAQPRGNDVVFLLAWLRDALSRSDEWARPHMINDLFREIAKIFALDRDPARACKASFENLERVQRRAEFARTNLEHNVELPSLLVLLALASLVEQGLTADPEGDLRYVCERGMRIALTAASVGEPLFSAREVVAIAACVWIVRAEHNDQRAISLLRTVCHDRQVLGMVVARLPKLLDRPSLERFLGELGRTPGDVRDDLDLWAVATGLPLDSKIAQAVADALGPIV